MNLIFQPLSSYHAPELAPYLTLRRNRSCDSTLLDTYLWADFYDPSLAVIPGEAMFLCMKTEKDCFAATPYCREADLKQNFDRLTAHFNDVLHRPLKILLADEESVQALRLQSDPGFLVREAHDLKDYLYDGEALRTLSGKQYHKKLNLIHKFCRSYEDRWEYKTLDASAADMVIEFLDRWYGEREMDASLTAERDGILYVLRHSALLDFRMGGILIDGRLEGLSIGSENPLERMAIISVEKADPAIPGLYQLINQQFLLQAFPDAELVNREDDMGMEGLRRAKESYHPIGFERKYYVEQII